MPVAATNAPMVAERPDVDTLGLVLPNLNVPHSGWPLDAQPRGSLARLSRSDHPIAACGQPNAFAFGSGIASTIGVDDHRLVVRGQDVRPVVRRAVVAKQLQPGRRRGRPRIGRRAPCRVPAGLGKPGLGDAGRHCGDGDSVAASVHLAVGGVVSLGDLVHQVGLLDGRRDYDGGAARRGVSRIVVRRFHQ